MAVPKQLPDSKGFSLPDMSFTKTSVLVRAIYFEDTYQVKFLLRNGSDPNKPVGEGKVRPLMVACFVKHDSKRLMMIQTLLLHEADPTLTDCFGRNTLMYACATRLKDELRILCDTWRWNFDETDNFGNTMVHVCSKYGNSDILKLVLDTMLKTSPVVNINTSNQSGHTPLDEALLQWNIPCAKTLCSMGGRSTVSDCDISPCFSLLASRSVGVSRLVDFNCVRNLPVVLTAKPSTLLVSCTTANNELHLPKIPNNNNKGRNATNKSEKSTGMSLPPIKDRLSNRTTELSRGDPATALVLHMNVEQPDSLYYAKLNSQYNWHNIAHTSTTSEWELVSQEGPATDSLETKVPLQQMVSLRKHRL